MSEAGEKSLKRIANLRKNNDKNNNWKKKMKKNG